MWSTIKTRLASWCLALRVGLPDPIKSCEVYKDNANGSCTHADGYLCDMGTCSIRKARLESPHHVKTSRQIPGPVGHSSGS